MLQHALRDAADLHAAVYACTFLPDTTGGGSSGGGDAPQLLAAGSSTGAVK